FDLFWRLNRSTKRTDVLFYFSDFQNRQKTGISYSPIPESVDPKNKVDNKTSSRPYLIRPWAIFLTSVIYFKKYLGF
ncbi:hypothetical protein, partial [Pediococcus damnosus]|uniref:hypothetical protein n=1 Tax=Pediococcus damnosus TaxID=51663 RepID=UPI0031D21983